jgi:hypothetical protein
MWGRGPALYKQNYFKKKTVRTLQFTESLQLAAVALHLGHFVQSLVCSPNTRRRRRLQHPLYRKKLYFFCRAGVRGPGKIGSW